TTVDEQLVARVHADGPATRLLLEDDRGRVLVQSDAQSAGDGDNLIDMNVPEGTFALEVQQVAGVASYTLTTTWTPTMAAFQSIPASPSADDGCPGNLMADGDFNGDGHLALAGITRPSYDSATLLVCLGNGDGTFQPLTAPPLPVMPRSLAAGDFDGDGRT